MLKGHVFKRQIFGNQVCALIFNTFLNGQNGVTNYKNQMEITYSRSTLTVQSGIIVIQGRPLEEDTSTDITAGTDTAYCKLVIEIDLDKQNTETEFVQGAYKIIKSTNGFPELTQTDTVKNNSGIYQYELARFRTTSSGITDFQDMRTFIDFESIYGMIKKEFREVLEQLQQELDNVEDGSEYVLNSKFAVLEGSFNISAKTRGSTYAEFPEGFNRENCVVVSIGGKFSKNTIGYTYGTNNNTGNSANAMASTNVTLGLAKNTEFENKIDIGAYNPDSSSAVFNYKIILMKI